MEQIFLKTPSVGSVIKKIMAINPELSASDMIDLVKGAIESQAERVGALAAGEFAQAEIINVEKALSMARATLQPAGVKNVQNS